MVWLVSLLVAWYGLAAVVAVVGLAAERRAERRQGLADGARVVILRSRGGRVLRRVKNAVG
jgi:hypothetical protein